MSRGSQELLTIGHSNNLIERFVALLNQHGVTAVADVRSHPYSKHCPQYSRDAFRAGLFEAGVAYVFLGKELGARSTNSACYRDGRVQFDLLAGEQAFVEGLKRLQEEMQRHRVALVCAEKDPLDCHRAVLVGRRVHERGVSVQHIHADGHLEGHADMEARMLKLLKVPDTDMFRSREEILAEAYQTRGQQIAYRDEGMGEEAWNARKLG
jgi:uncharacterized protein (DUF488 family)